MMIMYLNKILTNKFGGNMSRIITTVFIVLFLYSSISYSQFKGNPVTAKDLLETAVKQSKTDGFSNPIVISIGTMTGVINLDLIGSITLEFDLSTGKSTAWGYAIYEKSLDSVRIYGAANFPALGRIAMNIAADQIGSFMNFVVKEEIPANWKDSDEMMQIFNNNTNYKAYKATYPNHILRVLGLGVNKDNSILELDKPYWAVEFNDEQSGISYYCWLQALSGSCTCSDGVSVFENLIKKSNLTVFPNPSCDFINIKIPTELFYQDGTVEIFDAASNKLSEMKYSQLNPEEIITIDISPYSNGLYFIKLSGKETIFSSPLIIAK